MERPEQRTPERSSRSSLKFKDGDGTPSSSSISIPSDITSTSTSLENSKKNHKKSKAPVSTAAAAKVSRSASAPLAKFNAQRLGGSPQGTKRDASNNSGAEVVVSNPVFNSPSKGKLPRANPALASSSPTIAAVEQSSSPFKIPKKGTSLTRKAGSMLAVLSRSSNSGDKIEPISPHTHSARDRSPRKIHLATDTIVREDPTTASSPDPHSSITVSTTTASTGATTPAQTLSPKPPPGGHFGLRLSASTLGGTTLSTIQREAYSTNAQDASTSLGSPDGGGKQPAVSHTPRTPRNLLQSFLNIDTNRAAILQLDTIKRPTDGKEVIVAGTLDHLIVSLADDVRFQDKEYMESFLMTHRYFVPSHVLFEKLMNRFFANVTPRNVRSSDLIARSPRSPRSNFSPRDRAATQPATAAASSSRSVTSPHLIDSSLSPHKEKGPATTTGMRASSSTLAGGGGGGGGAGGALLFSSTSPLSTSRGGIDSAALSSSTASPMSPEDKTSLFVRLRIVNVLKKWIELVPSEFEEDAELKTIFETYLVKMRTEGGKCSDWASVLSDILKKQLEKRAQENSQNSRMPGGRSGEVPVPIVPKNIKKELTFLGIDPLEFARQLTLLEHDVFRRITPSELFRKAWERGAAASKAPNVTALIQRFNATSYWVASEVLSCPDAKSRQATLIRLLECLKHLNELNNFNAIMEITSGLNLAFVSRLKSDWRMVPPKLFNIFKQSLELMSPNSNWASYRRELHETSPPLVPFQGVYLTDLTFLDELPTKLDNGLINFDKMSRVGNVLVTIRNWQQHMYALERVALIQDWIVARPIMNEDDMIAASKAAEPISPDAPLSVYTGEPTPEWEAQKAAEEAASRAPGSPRNRGANSNPTVVEISETNYIVEFNIADLQKKKK